MTTLHLHPEWDPPMIERYLFETSILTSNNDTEQRIKIRGTPRRQVEFEYLQVSSEEGMQFEAYLLENQAGMIWVPLWWDAALITSTASIGATLITADPTSREFGVSNKALIWQTDQLWEEVTVSGIGGSTVSVSATTKQWLANTAWLVPCFNMTFRPEETVAMLNPSIGRSTLELTTV